MTTEKKIEKVDELKKAGERVGAACEKVGIKPSAYYFHKSKNKNPTTKVVTYKAAKTPVKQTRKPRSQKPTESVIIMKCSMDQAAELLRGLT